MGTRRPSNAWVSDEELDRAADTVRRLGTPTPDPDAAGATVGSSNRDAVPGVPPTLTDATAGTPPVPAALISTAAGYTIGDPPNGRLLRPNQTEGWDAETWAMYNCTGELHYVASQYGRACARARFYIAQRNSDGAPEEVKKGEAERVSREMLGGEEMAGDIVYLAAVQMFVSGQSLVTVSDAADSKLPEWNAYSDQDFDLTAGAARGRLRQGASPYKVDVGTGRREPLPNGTLTIHMWDRHPGKAFGVDSSVRPALPYLRELARLDQYVQSILLSRIALSGILKVPPGTTVLTPDSMGPVPDGGNGIMHVLATVGTQNIVNPGTAAAALPILLQLGAADQSIEHITLDHPLTDQINSLREMNLKRLAMSLDMAPEAMSGFSNVKYSNAQWIQDESVQTHMVRRVNGMASAFTRWYARPALDDSYFVVADLSDLESDEDRTEAATALYDRGEIDGESLRRLAKMRDAQPPEGKELLRQLAVRAVTANPSLFPALAPLLGLREMVTLTPVEEQALEDGGSGDSGLSPQDIPNAAPPDVSNPDASGPPAVRPPQPLPATAAVVVDAPPAPAVSNALVAACDVVVAAALCAAGSKWRRRVRARQAQSRGQDLQALYLLHPLAADRAGDETRHDYAASLVADRWPQIPRIAALHQADPTCLQATLSTYVADLIAEQRPHHPDQLAAAVMECVA